MFLRALIAAGQAGLASAHLASCVATFAREGLVPSPALRAAARDHGPRLRSGIRAGITGTPGVFYEGRLLGEPLEDELKRLVAGR